MIIGDFIGSGNSAYVKRRKNICIKEYYNYTDLDGIIDEDVFNTLKFIDNKHFVKLLSLRKDMLNKIIGYTYKYVDALNLRIVDLSRDYTLENLADLEELISEFNRLSVLIRDTNGSNLLLQENNVVIIDPDLYEIDYSKTIDELNIHNKQMILNYFYYKFMSCFRGYSFEYLHTMDRLFDIDIKEDTILSDEMRKKLVDEKPIDTIRKLKRELG